MRRPEVLPIYGNIGRREELKNPINYLINQSIPFV